MTNKPRDNGEAVEQSLNVQRSGSLAPWLAVTALGGLIVVASLVHSSESNGNNVSNIPGHPSSVATSSSELVSSTPFQSPSKSLENILSLPPPQSITDIIPTTALSTPTAVQANRSSSLSTTSAKIPDSSLSHQATTVPLNTIVPAANNQQFSIAISGHNEKIADPNRKITVQDNQGNYSKVIGKIGLFPIKINNLTSMSINPGDPILPPEPINTDNWAGTERYLTMPSSPNGRALGYPSSPVKDVSLITFHSCDHHIGCAGDAIQQTTDGSFTVENGDPILITQPNGQIFDKTCGVGLSPKFNSDGTSYSGQLKIPLCNDKQAPDLIIVTCAEDGVNNIVVSAREVGAISNSPH
jgi:hypothetical protein